MRINKGKRRGEIHHLLGTTLKKLTN